MGKNLSLDSGGGFASHVTERFSNLIPLLFVLMCIGGFLRTVFK